MPAELAVGRVRIVRVHAHPNDADASGRLEGGRRLLGSSAPMDAADPDRASGVETNGARHQGSIDCPVPRVLAGLTELATRGPPRTALVRHCDRRLLASATDEVSDRSAA